MSHAYGGPLAPCVNNTRMCCAIGAIAVAILILTREVPIVPMAPMVPKKTIVSISLTTLPLFTPPVHAYDWLTNGSIMTEQFRTYKSRQHGVDDGDLPRRFLAETPAGELLFNLHLTSHVRRVRFTNVISMFIESIARLEAEPTTATCVYRATTFPSIGEYDALLIIPRRWRVDGWEEHVADPSMCSENTWLCTWIAQSCT